MSAAQLLIAAVGACLVITTFALMRFPQHRREQYRGEPFSLIASAVAAGMMAILVLAFIWAQGRFEAP
jgi:hypothetical protein